jgi:hypothetical protein
MIDSCIKASLENLKERCNQRGYDFDDAKQCIVRIEEDSIWVDTTHPKYPKFTPETLKSPAEGPGAELKKILAKFGITASESCSCNAKANRMNKMESISKGWCENNIDIIVGWLGEEAKKRKLPFVNLVGKMLVKRAIRNWNKIDIDKT